MSINELKRLHCLKCKHDWDYEPRNPDQLPKKIQCPLKGCKSMRIVDMDGNKINKGKTAFIHINPDEENLNPEGNPPTEDEIENEEFQEFENIDGLENLTKFEMEFEQETPPIPADFKEESAKTTETIETAEKSAHEKIKKHLAGAISLLIIKIFMVLAHKMNNRNLLYSEDEAKTTEEAILKGMEILGIDLSGGNTKYFAFAIVMMSAVMILLAKVMAEKVPFREA